MSTAQLAVLQPHHPRPVGPIVICPFTFSKKPRLAFGHQHGCFRQRQPHRLPPQRPRRSLPTLEQSPAASSVDLSLSLPSAPSPSSASVAADVTTSDPTEPVPRRRTVATTTPSRPSSPATTVSDHRRHTGTTRNTRIMAAPSTLHLHPPDHPCRTGPLPHHHRLAVCTRTLLHHLSRCTPPHTTS